MNRTEYFEKIKELIVSAAITDDGDSIEENMSLKGDLGCDSLDITQLVSNIEDEFDIEIDNASFAEIRTVKDIVDKLVEKKIGSDQNE